MDKQKIKTGLSKMSTYQLKDRLETMLRKKEKYAADASYKPAVDALEELLIERGENLARTFGHLYTLSDEKRLLADYGIAASAKRAEMLR